MRIIDEAILARLGDAVVNESYRYFRDSVGVTVHDGLFDARPDPGQPVVVTYLLPYAVFHSSTGYDDPEERRLSGDISRDEVSFSLMSVGVDRKQAKWAAERLRAQLRRWRPVADGVRCELVVMESSALVRRDDDAVRPDGSPLFYGVDQFTVGVRVTR